MNPINAIIVEDEELARELIRNYLGTRNDIKIIAECENGFEGIKAINDLDPDLVFLDIQMPKLNGFEMMEVADRKPEVIFTTAFNQYAIKAFELNAVDYLLKPYSKARLHEAVEKAIGRIQARKGENRRKIEQMVHEPLTEKLERVVVKTGSKIKVIPMEKVNYLEAQDDYVMLYTDTSKHLKQGTMKFFETHLDPDTFIRVHRSYIVKIDQVVQLEPYAKDSYIAKLKDGTTIRVSKNGMKSLKEKLMF